MVLSEYHQLLRALMRDRGKSWSHSSTHTVLKEAGDYPWGLKTSYLPHSYLLINQCLAIRSLLIRQPNAAWSRAGSR